MMRHVPNWTGLVLYLVRCSHLIKDSQSTWIDAYTCTDLSMSSSKQCAGTVRQNVFSYLRINDATCFQEEKFDICSLQSVCQGHSGNATANDDHLHVAEVEICAEMMLNYNTREKLLDKTAIGNE